MVLVMKYLLMIFILAPSAHAGWFSRACDGWLMSQDPYQFEQSSVEWIKAEISFYEVKEAWNKISREDAVLLGIMRAEIIRREIFK